MYVCVYVCYCASQDDEESALSDANDAVAGVYVHLCVHACVYTYVCVYIYVCIHIC